MARATIPTMNLDSGSVAEPAPTTLDANGGALLNARLILRLHNPSVSPVNVTVPSVLAPKVDGSGNIFDINVTVAAGATVYRRIVDTTRIMQNPATKAVHQYVTAGHRPA